MAFQSYNQAPPRIGTTMNRKSKMYPGQKMYTGQGGPKQKNTEAPQKYPHGIISKGITINALRKRRLNPSGVA